MQPPAALLDRLPDAVKPSVTTIGEKISAIDDQVAFGCDEMGDLSESIWEAFNALLDSINDLNS